MQRQNQKFCTPAVFPQIALRKYSYIHSFSFCAELAFFNCQNVLLVYDNYSL